MARKGLSLCLIVLGALSIGDAHGRPVAAGVDFVYVEGKELWAIDVPFLIGSSCAAVSFDFERAVDIQSVLVDGRAIRHGMFGGGVGHPELDYQFERPRPGLIYRTRLDDLRTTDLVLGNSSSVGRSFRLPEGELPREIEVRYRIRCADGRVGETMVTRGVKAALAGRLRNKHLISRGLLPDPEADLTQDSAEVRSRPNYEAVLARTKGSWQRVRKIQQADFLFWAGLADVTFPLVAGTACREAFLDPERGLIIDRLSADGREIGFQQPQRSVGSARNDETISSPGRSSYYEVSLLGLNAMDMGGRDAAAGRRVRADAIDGKALPLQLEIHYRLRCANGGVVGPFVSVGRNIADASLPPGMSESQFRKRGERIPPDPPRRKPE